MDRRSKPVALRESGVRFRVLHPLDLPASRVNNAAGLLYSKGRHVLTQVRWAIKVVRKALPDALASGESMRLGAMLQEIGRLAKSAAGCALFKSHDIEVFDAVPVKVLLRLRPEIAGQCERMAQALAAQRGIDMKAKANAARGQKDRAGKSTRTRLS